MKENGSRLLNKITRLSNKTGKSTGGLSSSIHGLKESNKPRHYSDTTHNYGNFFMERRNFPGKIVRMLSKKQKRS